MPGHFWTDAECSIIAEAWKRLGSLSAACRECAPKLGFTPSRGGARSALETRGISAQSQGWPSGCFASHGDRRAPESSRQDLTSRGLPAESSGKSSRSGNNTQDGFSDTHKRYGSEVAQKAQVAQPRNTAHLDNLTALSEVAPGGYAELRAQEIAPAHEKAPEASRTPEACRLGGARETVAHPPSVRDDRSTLHEKAPQHHAATPAVAPSDGISGTRNIASSDSIGNGLRLVVADLHAPNQDERAFKALLAMMADNRFAELVLLGDAVELASLAWWGGPTTLESYKSDAQKARQTLNRLVAQHNGPVTLVEGNHDRRGDQRVERTIPQLHGSIKDEIGWDELGVRIVPEAQQPLVRGRLRFIHGHQDCGRFPPLRYAFKLATLYGSPGDSIVYGHTHKDQCDSKPMHGGPVHAYGLGTLEQRPAWLKGADSWTCSVAVADPESGCVQVLPIRDGVMFYGGRCYRG